MEGKGKDARPVAFFPEMIGTNNPHTCTCYAHIEQHTSADTGYAGALKPAKLEQYKPLLKELARVGYDNLKVIRKFTQQHLETRRAALRSKPIASGWL